MTGHFASLAFSVLLVGAAGDVINYFTLASKQSSEGGLLWHCIILGIIMTFLVPFILSVFGSTLIVASEGSPVREFFCINKGLMFTIPAHK